MSSESDPNSDYSGSQHWSVVLGPWCLDAIPSSLARRAGASPVTSALGAEDAGVPAARTLRGGVVAGGETRRQDPHCVNGAKLFRGELARSGSGDNPSVGVLSTGEEGTS